MKNEFPFPLLCDVDRKVGLTYQAAEDKSDQHARRLTYVIDAEGTIVQSIDTKNLEGQAQELLNGVLA